MKSLQHCSWDFVLFLQCSNCEGTFCIFWQPEHYQPVCTVCVVLVTNLELVCMTRFAQWRVWRWALWDVTLRHLVRSSTCVRESQCLHLLGLPYPENEGTVTVKYIKNCLPNDAALHPRRCGFPYRHCTLFLAKKLRKLFERRCHMTSHTSYWYVNCTNQEKHTDTRKRDSSLVEVVSQKFCGLI